MSRMLLELMAQEQWGRVHPIFEDITSFTTYRLQQSCKSARPRQHAMPAWLSTLPAL